jgi:glycerol-3-phosphate O-acyltransferase
VSALLFATARQVVSDQGLLQAVPDLAERRAAFLAELRAILRDMDRVELVSFQQFTEREAQRRRERLEAG